MNLDLKKKMMKPEMKHIGTKLDIYVNNDYAHNEVRREWDNQFNIGVIMSKHETIRFSTGVLVIIKDDLMVDFFLIEDNWSSDDYPEGFGNMVFYGYGFSGNLKEMRHTYFNPYLFYINAKLIEEAFAELRKYFEI
jgi:hypothetical protein